MTSVFEINQSVIKSVDDKTARELVARLCRAELRNQSIPESAVTWGGDQRAKDGGVDVRVTSPVPLPTPVFVKKERTVFQVKAEKLPPSKIKKEMAPRGKLRPAILELVETGGSYIIVATQDDVSDTGLRSRRKAILQCLTANRLEAHVQFDFYDSRRIADWIELHLPIITWLRHKIGQPLKGWQPYGPWAYTEDDPEAEYLVDDKMRVYAPSSKKRISVTDAISQLRQELLHSVSVRIVGLSGVGKTRLVQALFDPRVCTKHAPPPSENVIYVDLADEPEPQPQTMLEKLQERRSDSIIVIDNCGPDTHERMTAIAKRRNSRLKLITIEYDIRDNLPEDTLCYRLEGSSLGTITKLLKVRYKNLSDIDANRIAEFSDGNARVAFALASTVETGGEISRLRNHELFERLFQQKNSPSDELLRCAEAASLLYSFDSSDVSPDGEIARLATFAEVTSLTFLRHMAELKRRGLLQDRGRWRAVLPHAIANALARRMLQSVPSEMLYDTLIEQGGERIARSFSRRLGFLHDCPQALVIASQMFADDGKLGDLTALTDFEEEMVSNLAPLVPRSVLNEIKRATGMDNFVSAHNRDRARFARVTRSIAYEPKYFDDAVSILIRFALAETEGYHQERVRDMLKSLFYCYLSGTQASPEQRHKVVESLVSSGDKTERELGLDLISAGLEASYFTSHYDFEFGARRRDYGWLPRSQADVHDWFRPWIQIVAAIGERENEDGDRARAMLGKAFPGLWGRVDLDEELIATAKRLKALDGWPEGWLGVRRALHRQSKTLSHESLAQLRELENTLSPSDLASEIRMRVLARGADYLLEGSELAGNDSEPLSPIQKHRIARDKMERLGATAANSIELLETLIPDLCSTGSGNRQIYEFGWGIGRHHADMAGLLEVVRTNIERADRAGVSLSWVRGLIAGWGEADPDALETFLDEAVGDVVWRYWFVELQTQASLDGKAFDRLLRVLDSGHCPTGQFSYLAMCRATDTLSVSQITTLANKLALKPCDGLVTAIDLLSMVIHCADEKDERYKYELGKSLLEFLCDIDWSLLDSDSGHSDYDLEEVLKFALQSSESESHVAEILRRILSAVDTNRLVHDDVRRNSLKLFFQYFPQLTLELVCMPDEGETFYRASRLVSGPRSESPETALEVVPKEVLIDWCNEDPKIRYAFAAGTCKLFEKKGDGTTPFLISDTAITLLEAAPDKKAVVELFIRRFQPGAWFGSLADILEARLPLLDQFIVKGNEAARSAIETAKETLRKQIDKERARETDEEKSRNLSFE